MSGFTDFVLGQRWPLHPKPREREVLNAWVPRIARAYGVRYDVFLRKALSRTGPDARDLDIMTEPQLTMLASGTGVPVEQLHGMNSRVIFDRIASKAFTGIFTVDPAPKPYSSKAPIG